jgi:hypothetical protein
MSDEEINEPERIKALFEKLSRQPIIKFSRGCRNVPNEHGVYVIYGLWEGDVLYVGRTTLAVQHRTPVRIGLRRRLSEHRAKYGSFTGLRYLVVPDPRERALLENLATGILCPVDLAYGYKRLRDLDPADADRLKQVLHDIRKNMEHVEWFWIAKDGTTDVENDLSNLTEEPLCILLRSKEQDGSQGKPVAVSPGAVIGFRPAIAIQLAIRKGLSQLDALLLSSSPEST